MLCCLPELSHAKFRSDFDKTVKSPDGMNAYNCQQSQSLVVSQINLLKGFRNLPTEVHLTHGYQKCFDCYRKFAEKYAPLCPRLQAVLYELRNETDPNVGAWKLGNVMEEVKEKLPPFGAECHKFKNWHASLDRDFSTHAIFDGIESTPIVLLTDAVKAIWDDPHVWDLPYPFRKPPTLEADLTASKGEYKCGLLNGVKLAEEFARNKLRGKSCDEHGLGLNDIAAIHLYTQSKQDGTHCCIFKYLNAALENKSNTSEEINVKHVKPYFKYIRLLQHALLKLPPANGSEILFRGERNNGSKERTKMYFLNKKSNQEKFQKGEVVKQDLFPLWAFSSTTQDAQAAEGYFSTEEAMKWKKDGTSEPIEIPFQGARILYTIDGGSSARDVKEYSAVPEDNESLFCCATAFTIKSVIGINSGMLVVHMKQGDKQNSEQSGSNGETKN